MALEDPPGQALPSASASGGVPAAEPGLQPQGRRSRRSRGRRGQQDPGVMIPARSGRSFLETLVMRLVATAGIIGIGVAIAAIMASQKSHGWIIGLVVSIVSVVLAGLLWSSRRL